MAPRTIAGVARDVAMITIRAEFWELAGFGAALILAIVFAWAGTTKLRDRTTTRTDFTSLGLPRPRSLAILVPLLEIVVAILLVVLPGWGGVAAFALLTVFTTVLVNVIRTGVVASCACFGGTTSHPVGARHVVRNGGLLCLALAATTVGPWVGDLFRWT